MSAVKHSGISVLKCVWLEIAMAPGNQHFFPQGGSIEYQYAPHESEFGPTPLHHDNDDPPSFDMSDVDGAPVADTGNDFI